MTPVFHARHIMLKSNLLNNRPISYVLGLGNYMMSDDGIGLHLVEYLAQQVSPKNVEYIDLGSDSLAIMHYFAAETKKILIIDAARMGKCPGDVCIFDPLTAINTQASYHISTHEDDILSVLSLAQQLDMPLPPLKIMGIEPFSTQQGLSLNPILQAKLGELSGRINQEITRNWDDDA